MKTTLTAIFITIALFNSSANAKELMKCGPGKVYSSNLTGMGTDGKKHKLFKFVVGKQVMYVIGLRNCSSMNPTMYLPVKK